MKASKTTPVLSNDNPRVALWNDYYQNNKDAYLFPNEFVLRSFLGNYPNLKMPYDYKGKKICDISCGDGRNIVLLNRLGFDIYATEITEEICTITKGKLLSHPEKISVNIRQGVNWALPFEDGFFDYLLSWNACYYMESESSTISAHIEEFARILRPGGYAVVSVPSHKCYSLTDAVELGNGLVKVNIKDTKWMLLNGSIYHRFDSYDEVERVFGTHFHNFQKARLSDDCYGSALDYFVFVCQKK